MALIKNVKGFSPVFGEDVYLSENSTIIGDVIIGDYCSVWFNVVIRGDVNAIRIGNKVNIQDGSMIHCTYKKTSTIIGNNVSIGHNVIVHGCIIKDNVLLGMGSIIMDNCIVESNSIIAAGAILLEGTHVEEGCIYAGIPAKKIKTLSNEQIHSLILGTSDNYIKYSSWYKDED